MMLSNKDIKEKIDNKDLIIEPFSEDQIRPAGISLRLGENFLKPKQAGTIDPTKNIEKDIFEKIQIQEYKLKPNEFILGETLEKIGISKKLGFLIEGTSTLARLGVSVVQSAMIVDTGAGVPNPRRITLEIKNNGPNPVILKKEMKIARAVVFELKNEASFGYDEKGKYKNQEGVGRPRSLD